MAPARDIIDDALAMAMHAFQTTVATFLRSAPDLSQKLGKVLFVGNNLSKNFLMIGSYFCKLFKTLLK